MSGFVKMPNWVVRAGLLSPYELAVYMVLKSHADKHGRSYPSRATIAREAQVGDKTAKRTLDTLVERGFVRKTIRPNPGGKHQSNEYHVVTFPDEDPGVGVTQTPTGGQGGLHLGVSETHKEEPQEEEPQEEDLRLTLTGERALSSIGEFIDPHEPSTEEQQNYLRDLHLHMFNEAPAADRMTAWRDLEKQQASGLIQRYLDRMPRHDEYQGPEYGDSTYELLSPTGQQFADQYMLPDAS